MNNKKTILPLLLWLLHVLRCCGESTTELKSFHGNSAWEIVETSEYGVLFLITYFLILMCKHQFCVNREEDSGVVLQFWVKKQRNKALLSKNKALFSKNKALSRIKIYLNFIFIFQKLLLNHFYCMLLSSWVLVFPLTICFYTLKIKYFKVFLPKNSRARTCLRKVTYSSPILML